MDSNTWVSGQMGWEMDKVIGHRKEEYKPIQENGKMVKFMGLDNISNKIILTIRGTFKIS